MYIHFDILNFFEEIIKDKHVEIKNNSDKKYEDFSYKFDRKLLAQDQKMNEVLNENKKIRQYFEEKNNATIINNLNKTLDYKILSQIISKNNSSILNQVKHAFELIVNSTTNGIVQFTEIINQKINNNLMKFVELNENYNKLFSKYNEHAIINSLQKLFSTEKKDISIDYNSVMKIICSLENKLELNLKLMNANNKRLEIKKYFLYFILVKTKWINQYINN